MLLARGILVSIVAVLAALNWWVWNYVPAYNRGIGSIVTFISIFPAAASLLVLALSFLRVEKSSDNQFRIPKNNLWLKIIYLRETPKHLTICALFWRTLLALLVMFGFLIMTVGVIFGGGSFFLEYPVVTSVVFAVVIGLIYLTFWGEKKNSKILDFVFIGIAAVICLAILLGPPFLIAEERNVPLVTGFGMIWLPVLLVFSGGVIAFGIIFGLFRGIKALRNTLVGRILSEGWRHVKAKTCPVISVVGLPKEVKEGAP
jgi:cytochrome c biogenesis factor